MFTFPALLATVASTKTIMSLRLQIIRIKPRRDKLKIRRYFQILSSLIFSRPPKLESYVNSSKSYLKMLGLLFGSHTQSDVGMLTRHTTKDRV